MYIDDTMAAHCDTRPVSAGWYYSGQRQDSFPIVNSLFKSTGTSSFDGLPK